MRGANKIDPDMSGRRQGQTFKIRLREILERGLGWFSIMPRITCTSDPQPAGILISFFPIVRMSVQMHYCKDENLVLLHPIDNAIGEPVYKTAPHVFFYDRPGGGVIDNILDGVKHLD
jgi:hypothetical protein